MFELRAPTTPERLLATIREQAPWLLIEDAPPSRADPAWRAATLGGLLTIGQAANLLGVGPVTVRIWANTGKLTPVRTRAGHRRFWEAEVRALLAADEGRGGA